VAMTEAPFFFKKKEGGKKRHFIETKTELIVGTFIM
jgi:hypothetical protein